VAGVIARKYVGKSSIFPVTLWLELLQENMLENHQFFLLR
jgi:hypothetical protein